MSAHTSRGKVCMDKSTVAALRYLIGAKSLAWLSSGLNVPGPIIMSAADGARVPSKYWSALTSVSQAFRSELVGMELDTLKRTEVTEVTEVVCLTEDEAEPKEPEDVMLKLLLERKQLRVDREGLRQKMIGNAAEIDMCARQMALESEA